MAQNNQEKLLSQKDFLAESRPLTPSRTEASLDPVVDLLLSSRDLAHLRLSLRGLLQGVGLRPFVYRLATSLGLSGGVRNSSAGVMIALEGPREALRDFLSRFEAGLPAHAALEDLRVEWGAPTGYAGFSIWAARRRCGSWRRISRTRAFTTTGSTTSAPTAHCCA